MRNPTARTSAAWMVLCSALLAFGCGGPTTTEEDPSLATGDDNLGAGEAPATDGGTAPDGFATICHIPPGNHANAHTIRVGLPAMAAHLRHGDTLGACDDGGGETPTDGGTGESDGGTATDGGSGGGIDAGPQCLPEAYECTTDESGEDSCCNGLSCQEGQCWPVIG